MQFKDERFAMNWLKKITALSIFCTIFMGCNMSKDEEQASSEPIPNLVTKDIQDGIEKHIEEQTRLGKGYFKLSY